MFIAAATLIPMLVGILVELNSHHSGPMIVRPGDERPDRPA